jgi:anti-sigma factor RsiW
MTDQWTDRLSEYLDGELGGGEREALERHLADCAACRQTLRELRLVAQRARALEDRPPAVDLWPGVAARIGAAGSGAAGGAPVLPFVRRRLSFTVPQLAAAAVALIAVSIAVGLRVLAGPEPQGGLPPGPTGPGTAVAATGVVRYDAAVAQLESVLVAGRGVLDSTTIRVIEKNLRVIDRAIAQAQRALESDPRNGYLNHHLADQMRHKLELLRRANALVGARS